MKKSIAKNYIYNVIYQILTMIVPLITTPYLSRVLGVDNVGIYNYTLSIATYFVLFGSLGVAMYGKREIAYNQDNKENRSKIFFEILIMRFFTLTIALVVFYLVFCKNGVYNIYYKILTLEIVAASLDISWFFQGLEEFKKTVVRNTIVKIISVIAIFVFVRTKNDLIIYFLIYVLSNLLGNLSLWLYLPKYIEKVNLRKLRVLKHLKPAIALLIPQIAIQIYAVLDKTMVGSILGDMSEVGNYGQSQKIIRTALLLVTSLVTVMSPRMANIIANNDKNKVEIYLEKSFKFAWFLGVPIMLGIMATANKMVPWFLGEEFENSIMMLILGAPIVLAVGLNNVSGVQYLVTTKKQKFYTKSVIIGAIFNFVTNMFLIPLLKGNGAIITSVLAETVILLVQLKDIKKDISLKIVYNDSYKYIISGIVMFITTFLVGFSLEAKMITTIIQMIVGVLTYGVMLIILKDKMMLDILAKFKSRFLGGNNK